MKRRGYIIIFFILSIGLFISCRQDYNPQEITIDYNLLVVEGFINANADSSYFKLSRTQKPGSSSSHDPELQAQLFVLDETGNQVGQSIENGDGKYVLTGPNIKGHPEYRLRILTSNGKEYVSATIKSLQTPPIDSLSWKYDPTLREINFFANTHDAANKTFYYRWEYEETWQYQSAYNSTLEFSGGLIVPRSPDDQIYNCWRANNSSEILLGSSIRLSEDRISEQLILHMPKGTNRFNIRYSMLLKQYAMTLEGYTYWQSLKKLTEQGGSVFDVQPTELIGNITCVSNPGEPVIGYISAQTLETSRIFITRFEVPNMFEAYPIECQELRVANSSDSLQKYYGSGENIPVYEDFVPPAIVGSLAACVDCRAFGGVTKPPPFW